MRKQWIAWGLTLALALGLCACGTDQPQAPAEDPAPAVAADPNLGRYRCTSVKMDDMDIGPEGQWILLKAGGKATLFLDREPDEGTWSLSGDRFTLTIASETVGTGTLRGGVLTLDLMGTQAVFVLEGVTPPDTTPTPTGAAETAEPPAAGQATLACYGDLYTVTYPTDLFAVPGDGLTDLVGQDGTKIWLSRLDSRSAVRDWRTAMEAKAPQEPAEGSLPAEDTPPTFETLPLTIADREAQVVIYQEADGWHAAVLVDFGRDLGTRDHPMYAACLYIQGSSREAVWNDAIQALAVSLQPAQ